VTGKEIRLSKLFPEGKNAVVVAMDHGQTFGPMEGLVNYRQAAERLKEADGVLLAVQMIDHTGSLFKGKGSPALIARLNWNTIHCEPWQYKQAFVVKSLSASAAMAAGAEAVLASLVLQTGDERHDAENVRVFTELAEETRQLGIPLIGEVFPAGDLRAHPSEFHDYILKTCRIITELGADAIKTFYTGERFVEVTAGAPVPIFALGAEKMDRQVDALRLADRAVKAGARGVVFGRNVLQASDPTAFLRGLKDVVQGRAAPEGAAELYSLE
jgi:DhnA family fructose-bisphosphate aldolase class Ia